RGAAMRRAHDHVDQPAELRHVQWLTLQYLEHEFSCTADRCERTAHVMRNDAQSDADLAERITALHLLYEMRVHPPEPFDGRAFHGGRDLERCRGLQPCERESAQYGSPHIGRGRRACRTRTRMVERDLAEEAAGPDEAERLVAMRAGLRDADRAAFHQVAAVFARAFLED